jgi:Family of unknown function (DUF6502)
MEIKLSDSSEQTQLALHKILRKVLRPLVRLMLSQGINYTMILEDLKHVFVGVAKDEFKLDGKAQTNSRITLLTGVHRKDVQRILSEGEDGSELPHSIGSQIIGLWLSNPLYLDKSNQPLPLPRLSGKKGSVSFESLVASISKDFRSRPVLDEWLRLGMVTVDADDLVRLNIQAFIPNQDLQEKLSFLSMNIHDHMATAVSNLNNKNKPLLERCVYYEGLNAGNVEILHQLATQSGMAAIKAINQRAAELKESQTTTSHPTRRASDKINQRMNFGVYFYRENEGENVPSDAPLREIR